MRGLAASLARAIAVIVQRRLIRPVGRATDEHEAPVAIATIDIAAFVDLEKDTGVAERGGNTGMGSVASDSGRADQRGFRWRDHA